MVEGEIVTLWRARIDWPFSREGRRVVVGSVQAKVCKKILRVVGGDADGKFAWESATNLPRTRSDLRPGGWVDEPIEYATSPAEALEALKDRCVQSVEATESAWRAAKDDLDLVLKACAGGA